MLNNKDLSEQDDSSLNGTETADEILMRRFQRGDNIAFEELFHRYKNQIYSYAFRFLGNPGLSEEVVQELFLKIIESRDKYEPRAKFSTWLYTMLRNLCIDEYRRFANSALFSSDGKDDFRMPLTKPKQIKAIHQKQLHDILQKAVNSLGPDRREVFLMRWKLNIPFAEIAEVLGCPESTVKSRMRYALENLRKYLSQYYNIKDLV